MPKLSKKIYIQQRKMETDSIEVIYKKGKSETFTVGEGYEGDIIESITLHQDCIFILLEDTAVVISFNNDNFNYYKILPTKKFGSSIIISIFVLIIILIILA